MTDVAEPNQANFVVVPGSHANGVELVDGALEHSAGETTEIGAEMPGAVQILARAGDAILFHNGLWHAVAPSTVEWHRKVLYYAYGPSWLRLNDRDAPAPDVLARCDDVRRQLLGGLARPADHGGMHPGEEGAPLVRLLEGKSYTEVMEDQFRLELSEYRQLGS
jgi:ectoine hydroxylase-related dioxygenase (phytanoyl-CoA dioxygenase family)